MLAMQNWSRNHIALHCIGNVHVQVFGFPSTFWHCSLLLLLSILCIEKRNWAASKSGANIARKSGTKLKLNGKKEKGGGWGRGFLRCSQFAGKSMSKY